MPKTKRSRFSLHQREWGILLLFIALTVVMLYPLSVYPTSMVPEPTDPLLNVWRMQWNAHAFLGGWNSLTNIFNTNIFYPFPLTLAYSEHFLGITAQALPFLLITDNHLVGMNLSVLVTFVLSGYAMYLLVSDWTRNRWAGLVAGLLFAYSPHRFGQINHLELLVTQWLPFALLTLHWTLTRRGWRYPALFVIFFNLQALSNFHFTFNLALACGLLALVYALARRIDWRWGLWLAAGLSVLITLLINWPIWSNYLRFSDVMGAIRTPGEVRVYSAALTDYLTTLPHNLLYGWTFGRWQPAGHQFQPLMPVGVIGFLLALTSLSALFIHPPKKNSGTATQNSPLSPLASYALPTTLFFLLLTLLGLLLSFGLNDEALGSGLAPILKYSPYPWLYKNVTIFQGIRVPGRFGILAVLGLTGLAGWGVAQLSNIKKVRTSSFAPFLVLIGSIILTALIILEYWSVPLRGPEFLAGSEIPPVYQWLLTETPADTVVLELPFADSSEFLYEYYSSHHWRRLANGGTGFTPPIYRNMRQWFSTFPDARSMDVIQQIGIDLVVLHPDSYPPEEWQRVLADLPRYLPAISQIDQVGDDLVLHIAPPACRPNSENVAVTLARTEAKGINVAEVTYKNTGAAAFVADVQQVSQLKFTDSDTKNFTEPLVAPANETQPVVVPLDDKQQAANLSEARLATLDRTIAVNTPTSLSPAPNEDIQWLPLGLQFENGPKLAAFSLDPQEPATCGPLTMHLQWEDGQPGDSVTVQLLDPFGRIVIENTAHPWNDNDNGVDNRQLALTGSLPPGQYGVRVYVKATDGTERLPVTEDGVTIPIDRVPPLPIVIHPQPLPMSGQPLTEPAVFGKTIMLLGAEVPQSDLSAGDWLRFNLVWQADQLADANLTVFTQLIGPDGQVWGQQDNQPGGGWYGTSLWLPGQPVVDAYAFQISPNAPPGVYRLITGLYHSDTQERVLTQTDQDFVEIETVTLQ